MNKWTNIKLFLWIRKSLGVGTNPHQTNNHGRLAKWIKWRACDVGESKEGFENELWRRGSDGKFGEWAGFSRVSRLISTMGDSPGDVGKATRRKGWRMSRNVAEATEDALLIWGVT